MKTIKELAETVGEDKQKVYRYITSQKIRAAKQDAKTGTMYYDDREATAIITHFAGLKLQAQTASTASADTALSSITAVLDTLQVQLAAKDEQIRVRDEQITNLTTALKHNADNLATAQTDLLEAQKALNHTITKHFEAGIARLEATIALHSLFNRLTLKLTSFLRKKKHAVDIDFVQMP